MGTSRETSVSPVAGIAGVTPRDELDVVVGTSSEMSVWPVAGEGVMEGVGGTTREASVYPVTGEYAIGGVELDEDEEVEEVVGTSRLVSLTPSTGAKAVTSGPFEDVLLLPAREINRQHVFAPVA